MNIYPNVLRLNLNLFYTKHISLYRKLEDQSVHLTGWTSELETNDFTTYFKVIARVSLSYWSFVSQSSGKT